MMFSQETQNHIAACRICFMCRHLCPFQLVTGKEAHTPRGRAVLAQYSQNEEMGEEIFRDSAIDFFQCAMCNNCSDWCEVGYEPVRFIREARTEAIVRDVVPEQVKPAVERALQTGTVFELPEKQERKAGLPDQADVLLILGDAVRAKAPAIGEAVEALLEKAGVNYTVLADEPPTGATMFDLVGEMGEVQNVAKAFVAAAKTAAPKEIVVIDPADAKVIISDYPRWGCQPEATVHTATSYIAGLLASGALKPVKALHRSVTFHDPCRLARDLDETEAARAILAAAGVELKEIFLNGHNTRCCGGECVAAHSPELTRQTAKARLEQAVDTGAETLICACPGCYSNFSGCKTDETIQIEDIFVLLNEAC